MYSLLLFINFCLLTATLVSGYASEFGRQHHAQKTTMDSDLMQQFDEEEAIRILLERELVMSFSMSMDYDTPAPSASPSSPPTSAPSLAPTSTPSSTPSSTPTSGNNNDDDDDDDKETNAPSGGQEDTDDNGDTSDPVSDQDVDDDDKDDDVDDDQNDVISNPEGEDIEPDGRNSCSDLEVAELAILLEVDFAPGADSFANLDNALQNALSSSFDLCTAPTQSTELLLGFLAVLQDTNEVCSVQSRDADSCVVALVRLETFGLDIAIAEANVRAAMEDIFNNDISFAAVVELDGILDVRLRVTTTFDSSREASEFVSSAEPQKDRPAMVAILSVAAASVFAVVVLRKIVKGGKSQTEESDVPLGIAPMPESTV